MGWYVLTLLMYFTSAADWRDLPSNKPLMFDDGRMRLKASNNVSEGCNEGGHWLILFEFLKIP